MAKRTALFFFIFFQISLARAQSTSDTIRQADTTSVKQITGDTTIIKPFIRKQVKTIVDTVVVYNTDSIRFSERKPMDFSNLPASWMGLLKAQLFFNFLGRPLHKRTELYEPESFEGMFYFMVGLLFYFAIVKFFFAKYLANLMTLFFRASMRQQQLREQVLQSPFPSLLLNILFVFSGSLYGAYLMRFYHYGSPDRFWIHFQYFAIILSLLYLLKFLILKIIGWIFNLNRAVDIYLFVVFMTNKIIGSFLLPFLVLITFSGPLLTEIGITLSIVMVCLFYVYRFIAAYSALHKEIKISGLHFILYLCAFEIAPLLLIYKVLVTYLEKAY
ncbi:MAG TPA: DUF4271 domain-containing protein [Puia sp.]|nr:DUF4271 domain-containing protein [Puia sp.]